MSRRKARAAVASLRGRAVLPVAAGGVPAQGPGGEFTLVPAHYHITFASLDARHIRFVTALDADGNEVSLIALETELTREARRFLGRAGLPAPEREYSPTEIPEEAWAAYERLVPADWFPSASEPDVYVVRGAMPESLVATLPVFGGEARVPLVPRVAAVPVPGRRQPMFRLALRDVVRVQTVDEAVREAEESGPVEEARP